MSELFIWLRKPGASISTMLRKSYRTLLLLMMIPTVITTLALLSMTAQYNALIENIHGATELRDLVTTKFPEEIWDLVSGKKDFSAGRHGDMLKTLDKGLENLSENTPEGTRYVTAAKRINLTLRSHVEVLQEQIESKAAVSLQEGSYRDIVSIVRLSQLVLEQYIDEELSIISMLNGRIQTFTIAVLVMIVVILFLAVLLAANSFQRMGNAIHRPILQLEEMTDKITHGDLDARVEGSIVEELSPLAVGLNRMAGHLQRLIDERVEVQQNLQKAEMRALQAQITPHFVYNTLETIIWLAEQERNEELVGITMAFTDFFRVSLNQGKDYVSVEKEERHVRSYLNIQSVRYKSVMTYEIGIAQEISQYPMLKLLLQPLVENAIYHGIKNKRGGGHITVSGVKDGAEEMTFTVTDSGIGMGEEKLAAVKKRLQDNTQSGDSGFGLYNVNRRIRLYYNRELKISSQYGQGTSISFTLPCLREWNDE